MPPSAHSDSRPPAIADAFARCQKRAALVAFITAGFPRVESTVPMLRALSAAGADIVELGIPFSDPMADGPAIQRANARALENGATLRRTLEQLAEFRRENKTLPVLTMGYANSFLQLGSDGFAESAAKAGASGAIVVDLADADFVAWKQSLSARGMDLVSLVAPTTPPERLAEIARRASGFLYFISLKGVTGSGQLDATAAAEKIREIRRLGGPPVAVGFGVRTPEHARTLAEHADGLVVGSRLVEAAERAEMEGGDSAAAAGECLREIARALEK